jgi:DNA-binding LacI/PurR family transcriptional regulator
MNSVARLSREEQEELGRYGVPIVLLNRPPAGNDCLSTVVADNYEGGLLAGRYLVALGHRVIAHLTGPREHGNFSERTRGFQKAADSAEPKVTPLIIRGHHSSEGAYHMMKRLLAQRRDLTAVFAANDAMSFGVIRAVSEAGLRVPEDISVIGFDNLELASIIRPPLTTIHQPKYELGTSAVEILLRHAQRPESWTPEHRLLGVKLVERESCRRLERGC